MVLRRYYDWVIFRLLESGCWSPVSLGSSFFAVTSTEGVALAFRFTTTPFKAFLGSFLTTGGGVGFVGATAFVSRFETIGGGLLTALVRAATALI